MRKEKELAGRKRPICGETQNQVNAGKTIREAKGAFAKNTTP